MCYVVILSHKSTVLISIISGVELFNHNWRCTCYTTAGQIYISSQLPGRQELLPLQLVNYLFHYRWSITSSTAAGQFIPLQVVNCFFHCSWSTPSSNVVGQVLLPLQMGKYFFHCSWSNTSSIAASQLLPLQVVNFFHCRWSTTSYIAAGQLLLPV